MTAAPYPYLTVHLRVHDYRAEEPALVDTGFDGHLAIPEAVAATLPPPLYLRRIRTASGQVVRVPAYLGTVELADQPGPFDALVIALGDEYLIGLPVVNRFRVTFDHGQRVVVEP